MSCRILVFLGLCLHAQCTRYEPNWQSLDSRPNPSWYDEAKIGIFITWGVYSVPGFQDEWFWYYWKGAKIPSYVQFMKDHYPPSFTYPDFAAQFKATFYDPEEWVDLFAESGAKYVVFVTKHHEGFTMWPSNYSFNWNAMDVGPNRDLVGEFAHALRNRTDLRLGLYHSLFEWFNPIYLRDKAGNYSSQDFPKSKVLPCLYELINTYHPDYLWSDGVMGTSDAYWNSTQFVAWLYNDSPVKNTIVTNDRWGVEVMCHHSGVNTCHDRWNPRVKQNRKFENAMTLDTVSWGYRRNIKIEQVLTMPQLIQTLAETISCGGNLLINVAPSLDGTLAPIFQERLKQLGSWLKVNGEAVYGSIPWIYQQDNETASVWYTANNNTKTVYAISLTWPTSGLLYLSQPVVSDATTVSLLADGLPLSFVPEIYGGLVINLATARQQSVAKCPWGWVFKLKFLKNFSL